MDKAKSKFKNTANKMNMALIKLIEKKSFSEINVSEICEEAGVNRSTFYAHYQNTYDLLKETQQNTMLRLNEYFAELGIVYQDPNYIPTEELELISPKFLIPYLTFIKENRKLFKVYMNNLSNFEVEDAFDGLFKYVLKPIFYKKGIKDQAFMQYISKFFLTGITAIVNHWINNDCKDDLKYICEIIILCIRPKLQ